MLPMSKTQRIQLWLDRLRRHAASQLTVADFCRLDQISVASFYKWKLRLSPSVDSAPSVDSLPSVDSVPRVDSAPKRRKGKSAASHRFTELVVQSANTPHANTPHATTPHANTPHANTSAQANIPHATLPGGITIWLGTQPQVAALILDRLLQHTLPLAAKQVL